MTGLVAAAAYRRNVSDLRRSGVIPPLGYPELVALEQERQRLTRALEEAERSGPRRTDDASYIAQRSAALREGRPLPPPPPTAAEVETAEQQRRRDVAAAEEALLRFGDVVCSTIAAHPEWEQEARAKVAAARAEADAARERAKHADRQADHAAFLVQWLQRAGADELYVMTTGLPSANDEPDVVWNVTDPRVLDLIEASRTGQPL